MPRFPERVFPTYAIPRPEREGGSGRNEGDGARQVAKLLNHPVEADDARPGPSKENPIMADYHQPTVIQQTIPNADMTPLEKLILSQVFDYEPDGDGTYFYAEESTNDLITLPAGDLRASLAVSASFPSLLYDALQQHPFIKETLPHLADDEEAEFFLDDIGYEAILQDIVRRSSTLDCLTVVAAFTCSRMRPDGFGGAATFITADSIEFMSTSQFLEERMAVHEAASTAA